MVDRMLARCETTVDRGATVDSAARFATELAREEAGMLCDEPTAEEAITLLRHAHALIAA